MAEKEEDEYEEEKEEKRSAHNEGITVYLRIRPTKKPSKYYEVDKADEKVEWNIPEEAIPGGSELINNTRTKFAFKFNKILPMDISQEQVFERVGKSVVRNALDGFNSTVFAYGQTGSGKTFTITGGAERYEDRGIIPRSLSMIYKEFRERANDWSWQAHISYMEIYNEQGYDLLTESNNKGGSSNLHDLPKVKMMEDENGNFHLRNLSSHRAATEEEALNLLFLGDTNRAISETAMNQASSRSHCLFTVYLEARQVGSDKVLRSKLHMVDLAGSERVHKTKSDGQTLKEAQYINTSLFFLEMVIVALNERTTAKRAHIPYRNSMMTTVLRDSLGGNCKTAMIATVSAEKNQTDESISTCRFAQRVALVKNDATKNEETDPLVTIARLKSELSTLKAEVSFLKGEAGEGDTLTDMERAELHSACDAYVAGKDQQLQVVPLTLVRIRDCFEILKNMVLNALSGNGASSTTPSPPGEAQQRQLEHQDGPGEAELRKMLQERDREIAILVNMVRQKKNGTSVVSASSSSSLSSVTGEEERRGRRTGAGSTIEEEKVRSRIPEVAGVSCDVADEAVREDPRKAYEYFRQRCSINSKLEENKALLKEKYSTARALGQRVDQSRQRISYLKQTIEQLRRERAIEGIHDSQVEGAPPSAEEEKSKQAIETEKTQYKEAFEQLRGMKTEIETIQRMLEVGRARLQSDFDSWYDQVLKQQRTQMRTVDGGRTAWSTPKTAASESAQPKQDSLPLTGNKQTDDDIRAFYRAKEELAMLQAKR